MNNLLGNSVASVLFFVCLSDTRGKAEKGAAEFRDQLFIFDVFFSRGDFWNRTLICLNIFPKLMSRPFLHLGETWKGRQKAKVHSNNISQVQVLTAAFNFPLRKQHMFWLKFSQPFSTNSSEATKEISHFDLKLYKQTWQMGSVRGWKTFVFDIYT